ncbi:tRNA-dihydrouridine synthase [bacterium]|nr:tRNA-dihydrouridine synthase [bacterium]
MFLIPAIDVKGGKCVRVTRGDLDTATVYYEDPLDAALWLADAGAHLLHVVDLDAAVEGIPVNRAAIERIAVRAGVVLQIGGGVRDEAAIDAWLACGAARVIVGTVAANDPDRAMEWIRARPGRVGVALDSRDGEAATDGWTRGSGKRIADLAKRFDDPAVAVIVHTDIARDGTEAGANLAATRELARAVSVPVVVSGGVRDIDDIRRAAAAPEPNIAGVISGRAVYEKRFDIAEALGIAKENHAG